LELQHGTLIKTAVKKVNSFTSHSKYELLRCYSVSGVDFMSSIPRFLTLRFGQV